MPEARFAAVILEDALGRPLHYQIPDEFLDKASPGSRVEIPLRGRVKKGYILALLEKPEVEKVQSILSVFPQQFTITPPLFELAKWMGQYYCAPLNKVFSAMVPSSIRKEVEQKKEIWITLKKTKQETLALIPSLLEKSPLQAAALEELLKITSGAFLSDLSSSKSALQTLVKKGILEAKKISRESDFLFEEDFFPTLPKTLTGEQKKALESLNATITSNAFNVHLLHGITGSGKTEVYMQAMQKALDEGKSAIVLVPEVALTAQAIERFRARFQDKIAVLHHRRSQGERVAAWESIQKGESRIVLGARSAIFAPPKNLGLIIVDEEHDGSYKQSEESPAYHARDIAIMRGKIENACVVLGSATPSFESYYHALRGKYILNTLSLRPGSSSLPKVHIVSMQHEFDKNGGFTHFSDPLLSGLKKRHEEGEQSLLFLNRRGYYTSQLCTSCSHIIRCPHCDVAFAYHKEENLLRCHLCDATERPQNSCPSCGKSTVQYKGFGTEHVEKSLHAVLPSLRTLRMDRDTTKKKHSHEELISQFRTGKADVLIGTQMIAKGLHFPAVTFVGILNVDGALSIPDFRASETVFQLITQVAGRAGRADLPGEVVIQTFLPEHSTIELASKQDYCAFYEQEIVLRKQFGYPPFSRFAKLVFIAPDEKSAEKGAEDFRIELLKLNLEDTEIFPTSAAGHKKVKDSFRFQFLIRTKKILPLSHAINETKKKAVLKSTVKLFVDIDPIATFF
jgi:primosomal protein N' (replication factor Y) (superfamily II helicase)